MSITIESLKQIALRLSNSCYCRYWLHFNYPQENPILMAIGVTGESDVRQLHKELIDIGFTRYTEKGVDIWIIRRTSEAEISQKYE